MHSLETLHRLNHEAVAGKPAQDPLRHHPRIQALWTEVSRLPVDSNYRAALYRSLARYAPQIVSRPISPPEDCWDDLQALQQVTLADTMEAVLHFTPSRHYY